MIIRLKWAYIAMIALINKLIDIAIFLYLYLVGVTISRDTENTKPSVIIFETI